MSDPVASLDSVHFSYDGVREVLHGVSMRLERGRMYALRGPNGAGKSTAVALLTGVLEPTSGIATLAGSSDRVARSQRSACVYQQLSLFQHLTVMDNMLLAMNGQTGRAFWRPASARALVLEHFNALQLNLPLDVTCGLLPYPAQQQLEIARALLRRPEALFLDEPTSALDESARESLFGLLRRLNASGASVVLVTHDPGDAVILGAQEIHIQDGRVLETSSPTNARRPVSDWLTRLELSDETLNKADDYEIEATPTLADNPIRATLKKGGTCLLIFEDAMERTQAIRSIAQGAARVRYSFGPWNSVRVGTGIRVLPIDRHREVLFPSLSVLDNAVLLSRRDTRETRSKSGETALICRLQQAANILWPASGSSVTTLSGGNQQRLLIASLLEYAPDILVAEEPLMGVDGPSHDCIVALLTKYLGDGGRLLIATCFPQEYKNHEQTLRIRRTECIADTGRAGPQSAAV